jgi:hypothetical protein
VAVVGAGAIGLATDATTPSSAARTPDAISATVAMAPNVPARPPVLN